MFVNFGDTPSFPRKRESIRSLLFPMDCGLRKIWLFPWLSMDSRFRGNDGGEVAFHPPGVCRPHLAMGTAHSDPPPASGGGYS